MKTKAELLEVLNAGAIAKHAYGFVAPEDTYRLFRGSDKFGGVLSITILPTYAS